MLTATCCVPASQFTRRGRVRSSILEKEQDGVRFSAFERLLQKGNVCDECIEVVQAWNANENEMMGS